MKAVRKSAVALLLLATCAWSASYDLQDESGRQLLSRGQMNLAIQYLQQQTRTAPDDGEAFHLLSRAYYELEQWDKSIHAAERAVALEPTSSEYHLWLGRAYGNKAEHSNWFRALMLARKTRAEFEKAVALDGSNVEARSDLAEYYMEAPGFLGGGDGKARAQAQQLASYNAATSYWVAARLAEKNGDLVQAEQQYRKAIEVAKDPGGEWLNLAAFYRHQKRYPEMEDAIRRAVSYQKKSHNLLYDAGELLFHAGRDFPGAAELVRAYINSYRSEPSLHGPFAFQAHYLLGEILEKQGDKQGAESEYRTSLELAGDYRQARDALARVTRK